MSILENDADAEEAMQITYIKAYEHLRQFETRSSFGTWLTRIMINESMAQKKKQLRNTSENQLDNRTMPGAPDQVLENKELSIVLENAISELPEKYRLVFMLREIEKMSIRETSEILAIEDSNVKVRLNRAKTMLRQYLTGYIKDHIYVFHLTRCDAITKNVLTKLP